MNRSVRSSLAGLVAATALVGELDLAQNHYRFTGQVSYEQADVNKQNLISGSLCVLAVLASYYGVKQLDKKREEEN